MLLPLITYPYLIRVLGKETYGLVVFAQAIVGYLLILVGFGFNISATKEVSIHRDNKEKLSEIVSSVLIIKSAFLFLSFLILAILLWFVPQAKGYEALFYLSMWMCLYDVLFPQWYFQGIERMKYITYITLVSRLIFLGLIFVFIHSPEDYLFMPIISGIGAVIAGLVSLYIVLVIHKIKFIRQPVSVLKYYLLDSVPIFVSNVSSKIYFSSNKVILGALIGMTDVAYYDLAEKIVQIFKIPMSLLSQSIFPKISLDKNLFFLKRVLKYSLIIHLILMSFSIFGSNYFVLFLGGKEMFNASTILKILSISIPIVAISNIFGTQVLIAFGYSKIYSKIIITSGIFYLLLISFLFLISEITIINISAVSVIIELFIMIYFIYYSIKLKLWI